MSGKLVIILIGVAFILVAFLSSVKKSSGGRLINVKLGLSLGIIGVLMMMYGSFSSDLINYNSQIEQVSEGNKLEVKGTVNKVQIVSPVQGDSVDCRILTSGVYPKSHDKDIWVLLKPTDEKYYPQSDHTNRSYKRDGKWQVITRFGGDLEEAYDLIVYEANAEASEFFSTTISKWKEADAYPGLELADLPAGAKEVERIVVYLGKNCRGVF